ncbi:MAG: hypothetical protein QHJ73_02590, partial [Armatimonadota bacterium]|nr:hypothetical protein [Armatimonadota bacterium]
EARVDDGYRVVGWGAAPPEAAGVAKRHGLQGPLHDAFLSRFVVTYGTRGSAAETARNREDALRFCAEWNNWMCLHWGWDKLPKNRAHNWFEPPYPFRPGPYIPADQPLMLPIRDTEITGEHIARANLVLFGDPKTHALLHEIRDRLPLRLGSGSVSTGNRAYAGPSVNYTLVAPNPLNPRRYVVVSRGYLSSRIDPVKNSPSTVGKDLEALPFYWPDYVVWDGARKPSRTVQAPFVYLPETYLEAGFFDEGWKLDEDPPATTAFVSLADPQGPSPALQEPKEPFAGPVEVALVAEDRPGGFGVAYTEYRLDGAPWVRYEAPFRVDRPGVHVLEYRSVDRCGRFVYEVAEGRNRGRDAEGNPEPVRRLSFTIRPPGGG